MGFYVQDDYWKTAQDMSAKEQDAYFGALVRRYFAGTDEACRLPKLVRVAYNASMERVDRARDEAERKKSSRTKAGQIPDKSRTKAGQTTGQKREGAKKEREREREKYQPDTLPAGFPPSLQRGGETPVDGIDPNERDGSVTEPLDPAELASVLAAAREALS